MSWFRDDGPVYNGDDVRLLMECFVQQYEADNFQKTPEIMAMYYKIMSHRVLTERGTILYRRFQLGE